MSLLLTNDSILLQWWRICSWKAVEIWLIWCKHSQHNTVEKPNSSKNNQMNVKSSVYSTLVDECLAPIFQVTDLVVNNSFQQVLQPRCHAYWLELQNEVRLLTNVKIILYYDIDTLSIKVSLLVSHLCVAWCHCPLDDDCRLPIAGIKFLLTNGRHDVRTREV